MTYVRQTKMGRSSKIVKYSLTVLLLVLLCTIVYSTLERGKGKPEAGGSAISKEQNKLSVLRACRNIQAGEMADAVKFEVALVPKELVPAGAIASIQQLRNRRVANSLVEKEFLLQSDLVNGGDWYEEGDRLIEHTFLDGAVPMTVEIGSVVDIKLFKPKQEDDVVVAKTIVIGKLEKTLSFYLNSSEQENIKEANTEGSLFLVQYLDKAQPASAVTYAPSYRDKH